MKFLSLFSGIEAATVAWAPLGWDCVGVAEIEKFPAAVLAHHYPDVPNLGDVTKITKHDVERLGPIDLVCGGFPCQDLSVAGQRKGLKNVDGSATRSGLFFDAMRIAEWANPRWLFIENVPGMFSSNQGRDFAAVVGEMAGCEFDVPREGWRNAGVVAGPKGLVEWTVLDAQYHGLAQRRKRVFLVRDSGDWANRGPLFLEQYRLCGHPAPSRETRQVAPTIPARSTAGGGLGTDFDCDGGLIPALSQCITTGTGQRYDPETETILPVTHSLRGEGFDASEDGTGRGTPLVPHVVGALACNTGPNGHDAGNFACNQAVDAGHVLPVAFDTTQITSAANYSNPKPGDPCHPLASGAHVPAIAFPANLSGTQCASTEDLSPALGALNPTAVAIGLDQELNGRYELAGTLQRKGEGGFEGSVMTPDLQVRRLTPTEAEKLQGFEPGYTAIPWRKKPADQCPDGPRYKALGNSWAVPCAAWIGKRIKAEVERTA